MSYNENFVVARALIKHQTLLSHTVDLLPLVDYIVDQINDSNAIDDAQQYELLAHFIQFNKYDKLIGLIDRLPTLIELSIRSVELFNAFESLLAALLHYSQSEEITSHLSKLFNKLVSSTVKITTKSNVNYGLRISIVLAQSPFRSALLTNAKLLSTMLQHSMADLNADEELLACAIGLFHSVQSYELWNVHWQLLVDNASELLTHIDYDLQKKELYHCAPTQDTYLLYTNDMIGQSSGSDKSFLIRNFFRRCCRVLTKVSNLDTYINLYVATPQV